MKQTAQYLMLMGGLVFSFFAQQSPRVNAMRAQSSSTVALSAPGDGQAVEITNVTYEVTNDFVPGRPEHQRLLLRKTNTAKEVFGDIGLQATSTLEAWPLGSDVKQKPFYTLKVPAVDGRTVDNALYVVDRQLEEVAWWSVYGLGTAQHLFDSYVPLLSFSISKDTVEQRYVGLEVPPDDTTDARLKRPNVVAVLTYASKDRVRKEVLITSDDPKQAACLRSLADTTRTLTAGDGRPPRTIRILFEVYDRPPQAPVAVTIPLAADDLDIAHAQLPRGLHLAAWKR